MTDEETSPVQPGDILAGKYRVDRVLGIGGMGVVVAATHLQLQQSVAIKFALPSSLQNAQAVERFLREARAAVRLKSEHVAKVLDVGTLENSAPYMVMEYLEGNDLHHLIAEQGATLPIEAACDYILQACEALAEAHSLGIIHRDLKPGNLFLTQSVGGAALVKVLDFGISKITQGVDSALTRTTAIMGSPLYMAPEQMRSARNVDPRTDIWALGVILYELVTGRVPFEAEAMPELCLKVVSDPPFPVTRIRAEVPDGVVAIILRCLEKSPDARFQNAGELASALEPFAPHTSRNAADRARNIMSATRPRLSSLPVTPGGPPTPQPEARTASNTDASFEKVKTGSPAKSKTPLFIIAGILAVAGGAAVAVMLSRNPSGPAAGSGGGSLPPPATTTTTAAVATTEPAKTAPPATTTAPPATTTEPVATVPPPATTSAPTASAVVTATASVSATVAVKLPVRPGPGPGPGPGPTKTAPQPTSTDGIPDFRH